MGLAIQQVSKMFGIADHGTPQPVFWEPQGVENQPATDHRLPDSPGGGSRGALMA